MQKAILSLLTSSLLAIAAPVALAQQIQVSNGNRSVAVTTTESAERRADTATVHIGFQLYGTTSEQVNQQAAKTSAAIVDAVSGLGIPREAVSSENQSTGLVEGYQEGGLTPEEKENRKFQTQQSWTVRTSAALAAKVLAAAVGAGANQGGTIEWSVSDDSALTAEAAAKALQQARQIATQMASGLGVKIGALLYASNQSEPVRVMPLMRSNIQSGVAQKAEMQPLSLSPPMVSRSATVAAIFAIQ